MNILPKALRPYLAVLGGYIEREPLELVTKFQCCTSKTTPVKMSPTNIARNRRLLLGVKTINAKYTTRC